MLSILAGIMIAIGGIVYLEIGGIIGAFLFSMGLLAVLNFKLELFTGKAGLLATNEIDWRDLSRIWVGNFIGTLITASVMASTSKGTILAEKAAQIVNVRLANTAIDNLIYGIFCGILMYSAVKIFALSNGYPLYAMLPVVIFIVSGFNHCVADMFYLSMGCNSFTDFTVLIPTTIGNLVGTNIIPWCLEYSRNN